MTGDVLREMLLPNLDGVRKQAGYWMARCPAHDDHQASLSVAPGRDQPVLITCHAGCDRDVILDALGLSWADLCNPRQNDQAASGEWTPYGDALAVYDYTDETGELLFQVLRAPGKRFIQRRPDASAKTGWKYQLGDTRRVLYRLPKIVAAIAECAVIYVVEGEKDVHSVEAAGRIATCNPHGAGKWRDEFSAALRDAVVIVIADKDDPGYAHARMVAASLKGIAAAVEIAEAATGKDVTDHLSAGRKLADLITIWSEDDPRPDLAPDLKQFLAVVDPPQIFTLGDLLALEEKLMLTGIEGHGKTTLIRQIGLSAAIGRYPFTGRRMKPRRVLMIDCENPERQSRAEFRPLLGRAERDGYALADGMFRIIHRRNGIDLCTDEGSAWLAERVTAHDPELLLIGTLWKLHDGDLNEEGNARTLTKALDSAVYTSGCAMIVEAHSPHGEGRYRPTRPAGSAAFLRWPDFGLCLLPDTLTKAEREAGTDDAQRYRLARWRGGRDRLQRWPRKLMPGIPGGWPWVAEAEQDRW